MTEPRVVYDEDGIALWCGDALDVLRQLPAESVDALITDPPYGTGFMGREWDSFDLNRVEQRRASQVRKKGARHSERWPEKIRRSAGELPERGAGVPVVYDESRSGNARYAEWCRLWAAAALRVLKPGAHLVSFGAPRTFHRLTCGIEDAGFEIRDCLSWLFGSGFPKSLDVSKAIDKEDAIRWVGWGTALKPGWEPCVVARKPLACGTVAANVARYGTGALNIDACRIGDGDGVDRNGELSAERRYEGVGFRAKPGVRGGGAAGRWPANVAFDEEAAALLDAQTGKHRAGGSLTGSEPSHPFGVTYGVMDGRREWTSYNDAGGASRFFYTAKASRAEREAWGRLRLAPQRRSDGRAKDIDNPRLRTSERVNDHPTVKPLALMEWLIRLVTPEGGIILDPFVGSGTTLVAAKRLRVRVIGVERDERSVEIARQRIAVQWEVTLL